jgi:hypothetical protein
MYIVIPRDAVKPAEVLVVEIRVLPTVITCCELRIENGILQGIETLHLVGSVLVAPQPVVVLSVIVVVLAWIDHQGNLGLPCRTATIEIRPFDVWNIGFHQFLHGGAGASLR